MATFRSRCARAAPAIVVAVALAGCSNGADPAATGPESTTTAVPDTAAIPAPTTDRLAVVTQIVDDVLAPLLRSADQAVAGARDAATGFCDGTGTLVSARAAVDAAVSAYERLDPVDMGPISLNRTDSQVVYPVDGDRVDELVAAGPPTDVLVVNELLPASTRGLLAAEHLLAGPTVSAAGCGYLVAITTNAADEVAAVTTDSFEGSRGNPPYLNVLTGDANVAEEPQDTINVVVNMMIEVLDQDASMLSHSGGVGPASVRRAAAAHLATIAGIWGDRTAGLSRLVDEDLADRLADEIDATLELVEADDTPAGDARLAVDGLRATIGTEAVAALGVVVGFSDNDGDS